MNIFDNFTKEELENVLHKFSTWREITSELGAYDKHNKMVPFLKKRLEELSIDYSFVDNTPLRKSKESCRNIHTKYSEEEIFKKNTKVSLRTVRRAFVLHNEIPYKCSICGQEAFWNSKPLVLTMDHIDGDTNNNELSNLRWVCPNCDRQLPTFGIKNKKSDYKRPLLNMEDRKTGKNICPLCGNIKEARANYCRECYNIMSRKVERPNRNVLKLEIRTMSFMSIGKKYNVSNTTIKKWCKSYDLPYKSRDIKTYSDKEWSLI